MMPQGASVHASAVLVGDRAVLIRGPSGAGKSRLAFELILAGRAGQLPPAVLVGDDRVHLDTVAGQLWVRPVRELAGLIEIRGLGVRRCDFAIKADFEGFRRRQSFRIVSREIDNQIDYRLADAITAANAEAPDFDQAGQFGRRPDPQFSGQCVEMDTVIADQNGRRQLAGTPGQDQIERQP